MKVSSEGSLGLPPIAATPWLLDQLSVSHTPQRFIHLTTLVSNGPVTSWLGFGELIVLITNLSNIK